MAITQAQIEELLLAPLRTTTDEGTVTERSMRDVLDGIRAANNQGLDDPPYGMRIARVKPGSTINRPAD